MQQVLRTAVLCLAVLGLTGVGAGCGFGFTMAGAPVHEFVFTEGHRHYIEGDLTGAEKLWVGIHSDALYGPVADLLLAKGYLSHGEPDRAVQLLRKFLDNRPSPGYADMARKILVEALCKTQNVEAANLLQAMIGKAARQDKLRLIHCLARLHRQAANHEQAAQYYRTLFLEYPASVEGLKASKELAWMVVNGKIAKPTFSRRDQLGRAERLFQEGRFDLAAESYNLLLKDQPSDVDLMLKLARCKFRDRKNREAIKILKEILQKKTSVNDRLEALYLLSRTYWRIERNRDFELCCNEIINKGSPRLRQKVLFNLGAYNYERGRLSAALESFNRLVNSGIGDSMKADATWKIAWIHYRMGKFTDAAEAFRRAGALSRNGRMGNPSRYWQARSVMRLGKTSEAKALFKKIVEDSPLDYYGQQAAVVLEPFGEPVAKNHSRNGFPNIALSPSQLQIGSIAAAKALMDLELYEFALANLVSLPASVKASPPVAFLMARAAYGAREYKKARDILARAFGPFMSNPPDDAPPRFVEMAFPRVHRGATVKAAKRYGVDPHLVWAVVRQESLYDATAVSPAGALGLMQVTPQAAGLVGKHGKIAADAIGRILEPKENLAAGILILSKNLRTFKGRTVPAIASYNADIRKVRDWMKRNGSMREDEFIENIPYLETRIYVKKVLAGYRAYSMLHKKFDLSGLW